MEINSFTTAGLIKPINEDRLAITQSPSNVVISLCDGHWGAKAAEIACQSLSTSFPTSRKHALIQLTTLQKQLFDIQISDQPPETSVLAVQINEHSHKLTYVSYGDCRLIIARNKQIIFQLKTLPTWLGALSHQGLRGRLSVDAGLFFDQIQLKLNDTVYIFSDGIDECIYEQPTIPIDWIIDHDLLEIRRKVEEYGAQDNASLIIVKC